jgi:hypothetical protein
LQNYLQNAIFVVGSQPTYEDLKLHVVVLGEKPWNRSQPTYEDLKLNEWTYKKEQPLGSQPTYEDLKQVFLSNDGVGLKVRSLPTRNSESVSSRSILMRKASRRCNRDEV